MLKTVYIAVFALIGLLSVASAQDIIEGEPSGEKAKVEKNMATVVLFYADWCTSCKVLKPRLYQAVEKLDENDKVDLKIVTFDFSNDMTQLESAGLAGEHGLSDLYNEYSPGTGFAVLVDDNVEMFEQVRLTQDHETDEIEDKLKTHIKNKS